MKHINTESASMKLILQSLVEAELAKFEAWNQIPHVYSDRFTKSLHKVFLRYDRKNPSSVSRRRRMLICIAAVIALALAACAAIEPLREAIITWHEKYVEIQFVSDVATEYPTIIEEVIIPPLDEGWSMEVLMENQTLGLYSLIGPNGEEIFYNQSIYSSGKIEIDNTECVLEEITLNGRIGAYLCYYEDGARILTWENRYLYSLTSYDAYENYLIELAERLYK